MRENLERQRNAPKVAEARQNTGGSMRFKEGAGLRVFRINSQEGTREKTFSQINELLTLK